MTSLNESMATRLFQWARDMEMIPERGSWKSQSHQVKEKWRSLANKLHNHLGKVAYPEGEFTVVPEGQYKVRPYTREYKDGSQGEVDSAGGQGEPEHAEAPVYQAGSGGDQDSPEAGNYPEPTSSEPAGQ